MKRTFATIDQSARSGLTKNEAHEVLSWLESHVVELRFDCNEEPLHLGEAGTSIGDFVLNVMRSHA